MEAVEEQKNNVSDKVLSNKETFLYGFGNLAANLLIGTASQFIAFFYTDYVGITAATVGTILFLARLFDGVSDIGMGIVVDKTHSRYGKGRPWMKWMAVPYGLSLILLFSSPNLGGNTQVVYAFLTYVFAVGIIYTAITVPYNAIIGTMTMNPSERGVLSTVRSLFGHFGAWVVSVLTIPLVTFYGGGLWGWQIMAVTYAVISILLWYMNFRTSKEHATASQSLNNQTQKVPLKDGLKLLLKNKYWFLAVGVLLIAFINNGIAGIQPYYAQHIFGNAAYVGWMQTARTIPIVIGTFIVGFLMNYMTKRTLVMVGAVITIAGSFVMMIDPTSLPIILQCSYLW